MGTDLPDLRQARTEAIALMVEALRGREDLQNWRMDVADEAGAVLLRVRVSVECGAHET